MKKLYIYLCAIAVIFSLPACNHKSDCKIPPPTFSNSTIQVGVDPIPQTISASNLSYDREVYYIWTLMKTPKAGGIDQQVAKDQQGLIIYTFPEQGIYQFEVKTFKANCYSDPVLITVNASTSNPTPSPCTMPSGKNFKITNSYLASSNVPILTATANYCYTGLYDNNGNNIYFYFPKTFKTTPTIGDYMITAKSYSSLSGKECGIEVGGVRYTGLNPSANVHIKAGKTKAIELSVCDYQYKVGNTTYTVESKFEFNP